MPERERLLVVGEGFCVGVQTTRVVPGQQVVSRRFGVLPGEPVVVGDLACEGVRVAPAGLPREGLGGAAVQQTFAGQAGLFVDEGPELVVVEVVGRRSSRRVADLPYKTAREQLFQRGKGLFFAPAAGRPDRIEIERPPDDGGGGEVLPRRLADGP